jgi:hypothetical protein
MLGISVLGWECGGYRAKIVTSETCVRMVIGWYVCLHFSDRVDLTSKILPWFPWLGYGSFRGSRM